VAPDRAERLLAALARAGVESAIIGEVTPAAPGSIKVCRS
jgi:hydrogenase maturation factor